MKPFTQGLLPSCTTPNGPTMVLIKTPSPVNRTTIPRQNTTACSTPSRRLPVCRFIKYDTVNGIMGKTQGVKMAASPAPKAVSKNRPKPEGCDAGATGVEFAAVDAAAVDAAKAS